MFAASTLSARVFNQDTGRAKRMALAGPVFITKNGEPSHVLLSYKQFKAETGQSSKLSDLISMDEADDFEFDPQPLQGQLRQVEF